MENIDGAFADVFLLQDRLAESVLRALQLEPGSALAIPAQDNLRAVAAQEQFLQALGYLQRIDNEAAVDGAIRLLEELARASDNTAVVRATMGRACHYKYLLTWDRAWADRAISECEAALLLNRDLPEVLVTLGQVQQMTGHPEEAVRTLSRALKQRPSDVDACFGLAKAYESLGQLVKAEEACRQAIAIRPQSINSQNVLGAFLFNHGRYEEATAVYRKVIELAPDSARGHFNLAATHWMMGEAESSITHYHRSLAIRPEASAYSSLGAVHYFQGNFVEAAAMFEKGVALKPNSPRTWGNLGDAYRWMPGMEARSAEAFDRAILLAQERLALNPRQPEELAWMAEWLAKRGRKTEATRALQKALRHDPANLNCMVRAVIVNHLAGRRSQALQWIRECLARGYARTEFDQDPELSALREDPAYREAAGGSSSS